ncbi:MULTISPECIES: DUF3105 domain-containing protein [unclassified Blastococcus]
MTARRCTALLAGGLLALAGCTSTVAGAASPAGAGSAAEPVTLESTEVAAYAAGQEHVRTDVDYSEDPPVGGPHDGVWADCTGTVYDVAIRPENAVHSLEHGAVWVTYDPDLAGEDDVAALADLVEGGSYVMLSPHPGLGTVVSAQAWNHAIRLDDAADPRLAEFVALLAANPDTTPEVGASCENPAFAADPVTA